MSDLQNNNPEKSILITGVSSGIGLGMTKKFLAEGHRVFGSLRSETQAKEIEASLGRNFIPLVLDICDQNKIASAKKIVAETLQDKPLDAIINNAGSAEIGPLLHIDPAELRRQLDVLVVGQLQMIQAFHPLLLSNGKSSGVIFNISSVSGVGANYFFGSYSTGKHALEGLSKTLREELKLYGTKVVVIAPTNIATDIWPKQTQEMIDRYKQTDYYEPLKKSIENIRTKTIAQAITVEEYSDVFYDIFCNPNPEDRYTIVRCRSGKRPFSRFTKLQVRAIKG